jgi:biotin carboxyl carrier protein
MPGSSRFACHLPRSAAGNGVQPGPSDFQAEEVCLLERLIVAPHAGVFRALPRFATIADGGSVICKHQVLGTIELTRESFTVTSPHTGIMMGLLAAPGERVRKSQPLAWLRVLA